MSALSSPFPKLSQLWRVLRIGGVAFGTQSLSGLAHIAWADRAAVAAVAVGAVEAGYRKAVPAGKASGWLADLLAAYRQIRASVTPAVAPAAVAPAAAEVVPAAPVVETPPAA